MHQLGVCSAKAFPVSPIYLQVKMRLLQFPNEILLEIVDHLPFADIFTLQITCKRFQALLGLKLLEYFQIMPSDAMEFLQRLDGWYPNCTICPGCCKYVPLEYIQRKDNAMVESAPPKSETPQPKLPRDPDALFSENRFGYGQLRCVNCVLLDHMDVFRSYFTVGGSDGKWWSKCTMCAMLVEADKDYPMEDYVCDKCGAEGNRVLFSSTTDG